MDDNPRLALDALLRAELVQRAALRAGDRILLGVVAPLGQGELHAAYTRTDEKSRLIGAVQTANRDASQLAVGYNYFLSKRTALYGTFSRLDNKLGSQFAIGGGPGVPTSGGNSTGLEFGLRHSF